MMSKSKVPQIRFKGFRGKWEEKSLDSISEEISYGLTIRPQFIAEGIPLISARELKNGCIDYKIAPKISKTDYDKLSEKAKGKKGDIFLTKTGTIGLSAYVSEDIPIAITQNISFIRITNEFFNHQFILQTFKTKNFYKSAISKVNQSTIMDLQLQDIRKLSIYFPEKQEQINVSNYFQQLDKLIEEKEKKYQKLKQFKKAMLDKMFPKNETDIPEIRFKGFNGKWEKKVLSEVAIVKKGEQLNKQYLTSNDVYPVINGGIEPSGFTDKYNTLSNTITISEGGNSCGFVNFIRSNFWLGGHCYSITDFKLDKVFFYQLLKYLESKIMGLRLGSGLPNIQKKALKNFTVIITDDIKEQEKIGNYFQKLDNQIDLQQKELEKLKNIKKASLSKMFV